MHKAQLSALAITLILFAFIPYIQSIHQGKTKPHVFSWVIWSCTTTIVFLALLTEKGGAGAWPVGVSGSITLYVAFLAYLKKTDSSITRVDWIFFILALSSLPLWYVTADPLWAVVILTAVDVMGFVPSFRKAYVFPFEEKLTFFSIMGLNYLITIFALEYYSLTTVLFPATISTMCLLFVLMVSYRRRERVVV